MKFCLTEASQDNCSAEATFEVVLKYAIFKKKPSKWSNFKSFLNFGQRQPFVCVLQIRCSLKISQYSQENNCVGVSVCNKVAGFRQNEKVIKASTII